MQRTWALVRTTIFAAAFIAFFVVYLPWTWAIRGRVPDSAGWGALRWLAIIPFIVGSLISLRCVFAFAWTGRGTPAPFDPPRALVVTGFYRYVRNPMYLGAALAVFGETALFGSLRVGLEYLLVCGCVLALFVIFYEEPALREKFGEDYREYCRNVPRIIPRLTPWDKGSE